MKGLIKARGICVRISIAHGHRATQGLHALLAAPRRGRPSAVHAHRIAHAVLSQERHQRAEVLERPTVVPQLVAPRPSGVARFAQRGLCVRRLQPTRHRLPATKSIAALRRAVHRVAQHVQRLHHLPRSGKYTSRVVALPHRASPPPCLATIRARSRSCSITFSWPDVGAPRSQKLLLLAACIGHLCCQLHKILRAPRQMPSNPTARQGHPSKSGRARQSGGPPRAPTPTLCPRQVDERRKTHLVGHARNRRPMSAKQLAQSQIA